MHSTDRVSTTTTSPQRNDPPQDDEEKALIVAPAIGDWLIPTCHDDLFRKQASRVMEMNYFEFEFSPEGQQILQRGDYLSSLFHKIVIEDTKGEFAGMIPKWREEAKESIVQNMPKQLAAARVQTPRQMRAKRQLIALVKEKAAQEFYSRPEMIEKCVQADIAVALSACDEVSEQDWTAIQAYWSFISKSPNGFQINEKVQSIPKALLDCLPGMMKEQDQTLSSRMPLLDQAKHMFAFISKTAEKLQTSVLEQASEGSSAIQNYICFQQKYIGQSIFKRLVKKFVGPIAHEFERKVKIFGLIFTGSSKLLAETDQCSETKESESVSAFKSSEAASLETDYGDLDQIHALISPMTSHDDLVLKFFTLDSPQTDASETTLLLPLPCKDLQLSEDEISAQYFMQKMQTELEAREKAFTALADRVTKVSE